MSNIYIQEPPTSGKVLLSTTAGDIDIELWARETPKTCRNFVQLCMEGYYDGTIFHRLVKDFIVQGGDPSGTGEGGESIYGGPFKDEFHSRLRFTHRGLIAMANSGPHDNGSQFFFTLAPTPELQNKHTVFGKVVGDTIFNMIRLGEGEVGENEAPLYPHKIVSTKILSCPFGDVVPRKTKSKGRVEEDNKKREVGGTKNTKLLSFGDEMEEEDEEQVFKKGRSKGRELGGEGESQLIKEEVEVVGGQMDDNKNSNKEEEPTASSVREKLKRRRTSPKVLKEEDATTKKKEEEEGYYLGKSQDLINEAQLAQLKGEYRKLKREMRSTKNTTISEGDSKGEEDDGNKLEKLKQDNNLVRDYYSVQSSYKTKTQSLRLKEEGREAKTLELLARFRAKIERAKEQQQEQQGEQSGGMATAAAANLEDVDDDAWLTQSLHYDKERESALAKDANTKSDSWFEITDPRSGLVKRRRGEK